jgi:hypothetical protein
MVILLTNASSSHGRSAGQGGLPNSGWKPDSVPGRSRESVLPEMTTPSAATATPRASSFNVPPKYVLNSSPPSGSNLAMNASWQGSPVHAVPFSSVCRAFAVGKSEDPVRPVTYTFPSSSSASP